MDPSPGALLKLLWPQLPSLLRTAIWHTLSLSENSSKWDLRTELTVKVLRSMMQDGPPQSLYKMQKSTLKDTGIKGKLWVSKVDLPPPPEDGVRQSVFKAVDDLKDETQSYIQPDYGPLSAEWTGYRANATKDSTLPNISEKEKYNSLMSETTSPVVVLYFHGGAYYLCDPCLYRPVVSKLAKLTGGSVFSVRYRLAPQSAFPSQLLDALCAYCYLLRPPPGSFHERTFPYQIVLAGDSAGGNLAFALLQLLLQMHRTSTEAVPTVMYHGQKVELQLPSGIACNSPWLDICRSSPSLESNASTDYLPPPSKSSHARFPKDSIWPTDPPRGDIFCDISMMDHPLASPLACGEEDWVGAPPVLIIAGQELLTDECAIVAGRIARAGTQVRWEQWEAMPHCFALLLEGVPASRNCFEVWAEGIKEMVEKPSELQTSGRWWVAKSEKTSALDVTGLGKGWTEEEVRGWMKEVKRKRAQGEEKEGKDLPKL
ncbi:MAG: hypothetical protein M1820_003131 [Bogoriella megaspora]|nr:MAG: hypothetical protein M1820_003131 [Bogoriella megaspora]